MTNPEMGLGNTEVTKAYFLQNKEENLQTNEKMFMKLSLFSSSQSRPLLTRTIFISFFFTDINFNLYKLFALIILNIFGYFHLFLYVKLSHASKTTHFP